MKTPTLWAPPYICPPLPAVKTPAQATNASFTNTKTAAFFCQRENAFAEDPIQFTLITVPIEGDAPPISINDMLSIGLGGGISSTIKNSTAPEPVQVQDSGTAEAR